MKSYDVVIVGNGILGCSTALEIIRRDRGIRVAVVGPKTRSGGATVAAGAMLNCFSEVNHRTLSTVYGKSKLETSMHSLEMWPKWLDAINEDLPPERRIKIRNGTYVIRNSRAGKLDSLNYNAIIEALENFNKRFEKIPFGEIPNMKPGVEARPLEAFYIQDEGAVDARQVLEAIVYLANRNGVVFLDDTVVELKQEISHIKCVVTASGEEIHANRFLVSAGSESRSLLEDLADFEEIPLQPIMASKGVAVTAQRTGSGPEHVIRTPNRAGGCGLHMIPGNEGTVYLGATGDMMLRADEFQTIGSVRFLINAMDQLDKRLFHSKITQWHVGNRPSSLDGFPLVGRLWQDNLWLLSGTHRDGFHCSPLLAQHTADIMIDGIGMLGDHFFSPLRMPIRTMSQDEAIEELSLHLVSQFYENAGKSPAYSEVSEMLENQYRTRTRETYEKLEIDFGLAPEVLGILNWAADREEKIGYFRKYFQRAIRAGQKN